MIPNPPFNRTETVEILSADNRRLRARLAEAEQQRDYWEAQAKRTSVENIRAARGTGIADQLSVCNLCGGNLIVNWEWLGAKGPCPNCAPDKGIVQPSVCSRCGKEVVNGRGGCQGAQHGNRGCYLNNFGTVQPSAVVDYSGPELLGESFAPKVGEALADMAVEQADQSLCEGKDEALDIPRFLRKWPD